MVSVSVASVVDRVFEIRLVQQNTICIYCRTFELRYAIGTYVDTGFLVGFVLLDLLLDVYDL